MRKTISPVLFSILISVVLAGEKKPEKTQFPKATLISEDIYDTTERWQAMFGLDGKIEVSKGRRNERQAPIDGPVFLSFTAKPQKAGWYTFIFAQVNQFQQAYQIHAVRLLVADRFKGSKAVGIGPGISNHQALRTCAPGTEAKVNWGYYPGGEGIEGGWKLVAVKYDPKSPPPIPGFEKAMDEKKPEPPKAKKIAELLYDTTDRWQAMFGVDGKLRVSQGRRDARATRKDGGETLSLTAKPLKVGFYTFTFIRVDSGKRVYQVHAVLLTVFDRFKNSTSPVISPAMNANQATTTTAPGAEVKVTWSYHSGVITGGWKLSSITYADRRPPPIPGFEKVTGE